LREGAGAEEAHIIYVPAAEEFCWASDPSLDDKPMDARGLLHVQRRLAAFGVPLAFNVEENGRIQGVVSAREARECRWLAIPVPGRTNFSAMLRVHGAWSGPVPERVLRLLEASLPSLTVFIGRFLDASHAARQRQQLNALSEVARAITQTRDLEAVLTRLATTIASVTSYELILLDVLADDGRHLRHRCINESRWSESPQMRMWREWGLTREVEPRYLEVARTRQPGLFPTCKRRAGIARGRDSSIAPSGILRRRAPSLWGRGAGISCGCQFPPEPLPAAGGGVAGGPGGASGGGHQGHSELPGP
jgi:hypothetical protein